MLMKGYVQCNPFTGNGKSCFGVFSRQTLTPVQRMIITAHLVLSLVRLSGKLTVPNANLLSQFACYCVTLVGKISTTYLGPVVQN